ncbi:methyltransferase domain-containing protein [Azoarcus sp. L1K30]|uniref:methyltransferase domain-containing protein n=1 Tax=Azoarcus sp. L1K30 TaxID=2820277 RepID=UPI001B8237FB|nr:methyltransferase domain-containing protein [Azoarcus sp. L1K30]MBR0564548.1 methyltransferase domain-containing protein [Azoarcus sp. L1K30]
MNSPEQTAANNDSPRSDAHLQAYARANQLVTAGELADGFEILRGLADVGTQCWEVYNDLAAIAISSNDLEAACTLFEVAAAQPEAPQVVTLRLASAEAARTGTDCALSILSPLLRKNGSDTEVLALVREILSAEKQISPVAWARLISDLRAPTPAQREADARQARLEEQNNQLTAENRRLTAQIDALRRELRLAPLEKWNSADSRAWEGVHALDDHQWLNVLIRSVTVPAYNGFPLPGFPSEDLQVGMVGSSNEAALREGMRFYRAVREHCQLDGVRWDGSGRLLDFGTGWGRYARIFMHDFRPENVVGVDVSEQYIDVCRETFPYARFETVTPLPPTSLESDGFDLIIAYSVFSHLSAAASDAWIAEFTRILRPGGMIAITTQGRSLLGVCEQMRAEKEFSHPWHRHLANSFVDRTACEAAYDSGEFLHSATGYGVAGSEAFYGESLIPRGYVERHWTHALELTAFIDDRNYLPQALIVLRKPT